VKYSRFEWLAMLVGSASIAGAVLATSRHGVPVEEGLAQALLLLVLVGAVHWGRRGGSIMAGIAAAAYLALRVPLLVRDGLSADVAGLLVTHLFTYGVVGIGGGELCGRVRYLLARLESAENIDEPTALFNQRAITPVLCAMVGRYERYGESFAIVTIAIGDEAVTRPKSGPQRLLLLSVASRIRSGVRLVDDVARMDDGRFLIVMPHTPKAGAKVAAERLSGSVVRLLGASPEAVRTEILAVDGDLAAIRALSGLPKLPEGPAASDVAA